MKSFRSKTIACTLVSLTLMSLSTYNASFSVADDANLCSHNSADQLDLKKATDLKTAETYQILAGAALTLGATELGVVDTSTGINGDAVADLSAAIACIGALPGYTGTADLGGLTYTPGVYLSPGGAAMAVTGNVVLDAKGDPDAYFIFYTPAALNTTASITVTLKCGAQAKNVFWVAGGAITTGASDVLVGTFMSNAAITTGASSLITGRLMAAAAVTVGASNIFSPFTN